MAQGGVEHGPWPCTRVHASAGHRASGAVQAVVGIAIQRQQRRDVGAVVAGEAVDFVEQAVARAEVGDGRIRRCFDNGLHRGKLAVGLELVAEHRQVPGSLVIRVRRAVDPDEAVARRHPAEKRVQVRNAQIPVVLMNATASTAARAAGVSHA